MSGIGSSTVAILIGNSDNKLSQNDWSHYCLAMNEQIREICFQVYFYGGSEWDAPWQNACWVVLVEDQRIENMLSVIEDLRRSFHQDSVAVIVGQTQMV